MSHLSNIHLHIHTGMELVYVCSICRDWDEELIRSIAKLEIHDPKKVKKKKENIKNLIHSK